MKRYITAFKHGEDMGSVIGTRIANWVMTVDTWTRLSVPAYTIADWVMIVDTCVSVVVWNTLFVQLTSLHSTDVNGHRQCLVLLHKMACQRRGGLSKEKGGEQAQGL